MLESIFGNLVVCTHKMPMSDPYILLWPIINLVGWFMTYDGVALAEHVFDVFVDFGVIVEPSSSRVLPMNILQIVLCVSEFRGESFDCFPCVENECFEIPRQFFIWVPDS